jgi:hypothetical protein
MWLVVRKAIPESVDPSNRLTSSASRNVRAQRLCDELLCEKWVNPLSCKGVLNYGSFPDRFRPHS